MAWLQKLKYLLYIPQTMKQDNVPKLYNTASCGMIIWSFCFLNFFIHIINIFV